MSVNTKVIRNFAFRSKILYKYNMRSLVVLFGLIALSTCKAWINRPKIYGSERCVNMWDEGCINGQIPGSGGDDDYLNGGFNPGKRCINMWDEGCINNQLGGSGGDDDYLNGGFNPGKRCINMWDDGCVNGQLGGSGGDDDYLNGGFNPGKRSLHGYFSKLRKSHKASHA